MFGFGIWEIVLILVVALMVLGPQRLPTVARQLGKTLREFRRALTDFRLDLEEENAGPSSQTPTQPTVQPAKQLHQPNTSTAPKDDA